MEQVVQQIIGGLATGAIYACIALSIVMIYQAIDHLNFAQGEMAMFSTYIAWQLMQWGIPYWGAFFITIVLSFILGTRLSASFSSRCITPRY
jgi:branched-chain amino acid transport system permease protein